MNNTKKTTKVVKGNKKQSVDMPCGKIYEF